MGKGQKGDLQGRLDRSQQERDKGPYEDPSFPIDARVDGLLSRMSLEDKVRELMSSFSASSLAGSL